MTGPPVDDAVAIRAEHPDDASAIAAVVEAAFGSPVEARLVEDIRRSPEFEPEWSLVAEIDGEIVGHVMVSYARLVPEVGEEHRRIAMLSPLAVTPEAQRRGVGAQLVRSVARAAWTKPANRASSSRAAPPTTDGSGSRPPRRSASASPFRTGHRPKPHRCSASRPTTAPSAAQVVYPPAFDAVTGH